MKRHTFCVRQLQFPFHDAEVLGAYNQEGSARLVLGYDVEGSNRRRLVCEVRDERTMCDESGR